MHACMHACSECCFVSSSCSVPLPLLVPLIQPVPAEDSGNYEQNSGREGKIQDISDVMWFPRVKSAAELFLLLFIIYKLYNYKLIIASKMRLLRNAAALRRLGWRRDPPATVIVVLMSVILSVNFDLGQGQQFQVQDNIRLGKTQN